MTTLGFYQKLSGQTPITTRAAAQLAGVSIPAASMALRRLAAEGLCLSLKKGIWLVGKASSKPGALVTAAAAPYVAYLSGWSALRLHGRIQQIPQMQFAVTLGRPGELETPGGRVALHRLTPGLFGGYAYDPRAEGFVASPEKALFDLAYLSSMNRSRVSGNLPETDLKGLRWKEVQAWLRRIATPRIRAAVDRALKSLREQHAEE
jgi:hypothetical protein